MNEIIAVAYAVLRKARVESDLGGLPTPHVVIDLSDSLSFDLKAVLYGVLDG
ncbi:hypothetical protein N2603_26155 [Bradyrhizobium huanghuaihaiense]|uniref:hypothetical protein n=1 Tax=Bradyrhizobium huanghuaihaiense TaxID=990078 RepID=UPI0021AA4F64|nr:hypothetical protein [Bradyrhizobium sp. CB3035]UWU73560.1 hypothetical protein N2603_26155 [Bradyrhizobium sp. CB3035]